LADDAKDGGLVFHPMDQFIVKPLFGDGPVGMKYFPYIMTLFMFILFSNYLGLLPMAYTPTSHIAVTGVLAVAVFLAVTVLGFVKNGASFLSLFWVSSAPLALRPILALIEVISYFVRPVSHSIRLAGNMMAGHAVIKVFAAFAAVVAIAPKFSRPSPPWWRSRRCRFWQSPQCTVWRCWLPAFRPTYSPF